MATEVQLSELLGAAAKRAGKAPDLESVIEDAGRQRLAAYYLYVALIAGIIDESALAPARWPPQLAEPMNRLGLERFAPRTVRGLDAELNPSQQAIRRSPGRQEEFAQLTADLINGGAFGPLRGEADRVRPAAARDRTGFDFELLADERVLGTCMAEDHWELVAQQLASAPYGDDQQSAGADAAPFAGRVATRLRESGISHAVSAATNLAVGFYPLGTAAGIGTRLIRSRSRTGRQEAAALRRVDQALRRLRADADGELSREHSRLSR